MILDGLWILQRNKLLTSGFVYQIALYLLLNRKVRRARPDRIANFVSPLSKIVIALILPAGVQDDECVSVHSLCWEHLGSLSDGAVEMLADTVCMQLGLCQHLLKDYANARSMLHKARTRSSPVLGNGYSSLCTCSSTSVANCITDSTLEPS